MEDWRLDEDLDEPAAVRDSASRTHRASADELEDEDELPPLVPDLPLDDQDRILLVLSYLGILALVPFLTARKEFVQWHARQGLLLFGVSLTTLFAMILADVVLWQIHLVFGILFLLLILTSGFGVLALVVACILKAFEGERWRIPFLGDFVERL